MNWLAEGKPSSFVQRLEEVAKKWDLEAGRVKNMPCKGRGFGESRVLLPSSNFKQDVFYRRVIFQG